MLRCTSRRNKACQAASGAAGVLIRNCTVGTPAASDLCHPLGAVDDGVQVGPPLRRDMWIRQSARARSTTAAGKRAGSVAKSASLVARLVRLVAWSPQAASAATKPWSMAARSVPGEQATSTVCPAAGISQPFACSVSSQCSGRSPVAAAPTMTTAVAPASRNRRATAEHRRLAASDSPSDWRASASEQAMTPARTVSTSIPIDFIRLFRSPHHQSAVHEQHLAGHEAAPVRGEEQHRPGHVLGPRDAAQRRRRDDALAELRARGRRWPRCG